MNRLITSLCMVAVSLAAFAVNTWGEQLPLSASGSVYVYAEGLTKPHPAAGFKVYLYSEKLGWSKPSFIDSYGRYALYDIPPARYLMRIINQSDENVWQQEIEIPSNAQPTEVRAIVLPDRIETVVTRPTSLGENHVLLLRDELARMAVHVGSSRGGNDPALTIFRSAGQSWLNEEAIVETAALRGQVPAKDRVYANTLFAFSKNRNDADALIEFTHDRREYRFRGSVDRATHTLFFSIVRLGGPTLPPSKTTATKRP